MAPAPRSAYPLGRVLARREFLGGGCLRLGPEAVEDGLERMVQRLVDDGHRRYEGEADHRGHPHLHPRRGGDALQERHREVHRLVDRHGGDEHGGDAVEYTHEDQHPRHLPSTALHVGLVDGVHRRVRDHVHPRDQVEEVDVPRQHALQRPYALADLAHKGDEAVPGEQRGDNKRAHAEQPGRLQVHVLRGRAICHQKCARPGPRSPRDRHVLLLLEARRTMARRSVVRRRGRAVAGRSAAEHEQRC
eukprot:scaffold44496_cov64-Phaeocystis_antarctica.AAC.1